MAEQAKIERLHRLLFQERLRMVEAAAEGGTLPPAKFLGYLADVDGAILAVEAVLEDWTGLRAPSRVVNGQRSEAAIA